MRWSMRLLARTFAVFVVVVATAHTMEQRLSHCDDPPTGTALTIYEGAPFVYREIHELRSGRERRVEPLPLAANFALFAATAFVSAALWSRATPRVPLPLGAEPPPQATARNEPRRLGLAILSGSCLAVTLAGALVGLGLFSGPLGWWCGARLCSEYRTLERRPHGAAVAARWIGVAVAVTGMLVMLGILVFWRDYARCWT
jgi:hypothetical protein